MLRLRTLRWSVPLGLVALLLPSCTDGAGDSSDTTLAPIKTVSETTTTTPTTTIVETTTTTGSSTTTTTAPTIAAAAVSSEGPGPYEVTSTVVSHETTQKITVWAPEAEGPWPVVFGYHGVGGDRRLLERSAVELAQTGAVVVVPYYRSHRHEYWLQDTECAYRYGRTIVEGFGGDLELPVTFFGHSLGATIVLWNGLDESTVGPNGTFTDCFDGAPRPDVIVAVAGCYYQHGFDTFEFWYPPTPDRDVDVILVAGTDDQECEAWQSRDAASAMRSDGYVVDLREIDGNHMSLIFRHMGVSRDNDNEGMQVVNIIRDALLKHPGPTGDSED